MHTSPKHLVPAPRRPLVRWPLWIVLAVAAHAFLAGCGGSSQSTGESTPATEAPAAEAPATEAGGEATPEAAAPGGDETQLGAKVYAARCALCHGAGGAGDGPASAGLNPKPRNHTDQAYMATITDEQLVDVIRNGKGTMPAWGKVLSEAELTAVAKHVRSLAK